MRLIYFFCLPLIFSACKDDQVRNPDDKKLLILQVGQEFEGGVEMILPISGQTIETLNPYYTTLEEGLQASVFFQSEVLGDTLFSFNKDRILSYEASFIPKEEFAQSMENEVLSEEDFVQIVSSTEFPLQEIWSKVSDLEVVHTFMSFNQNEKIGITRWIVQEYDESLNTSIPVVKYFIYLVN